MSEPHRTMIAALALFAITAVGGLAMSALRLSSQAAPPSWLAMLHGFLAAAGFTLLLYAAATLGLPALANAALLLFALAAAIGATLNLAYHLRASSCH